MDAPGRGILKVVSILFIIFGAIATVLSIIALVGSSWLSSQAQDTASMIAAGVTGLLVAGSVVLLITSALELILGIVGLNKSGDPAHANFFIISGIILCALSIIGMILYFQITSFIGFVLPVLYIVGGAMNKNTASRT
jgi:hypothetical protein